MAKTAPDSTGQAPQICALDGCDLAARNVPGNLTRTRMFCSAKHREMSGVREAARPWCPVCRSKFSPNGEGKRGRPPTYCSSACKTAREREIDKATRELAKDSDRGDPRPLLERALLLWSWWFARNEDDVVYKFWPDGQRPAWVTSPPDRRVRDALRDRINRLQARVRAEDAEVAKAQRLESERRVRENINARLSEQAEADQAWRSELLDGSEV